MFDLQARQKIAQDLIFAITVVFVIRPTKECRKLMFADTELSQRQDSENILRLQIESDFQFPENDVVVQFFFRLRLFILFYISIIPF